MRAVSCEYGFWNDWSSVGNESMPTFSFMPYTATRLYAIFVTFSPDEKHNVLNAAYSYYNVATTVPLKQLMNDLLIFAKQQDFDVFNALDIMENGDVLKDLKFGIGDGHLQYYIYNWMCPEVTATKVGLVLL